MDTSRNIHLIIMERIEIDSVGRLKRLEIDCLMKEKFVVVGCSADKGASHELSLAEICFFFAFQEQLNLHCPISRHS